VLENIGRVEECLVPTGATGLQDERLELHEVAESAAAPEAHDVLDVPDAFSQATVIRRERKGDQ
jgi:hypothetical protein